MQLVVGTGGSAFEFDDAQMKVTSSSSVVRNELGLILARTDRLSCDGYLLGDTQDELTTISIALATALSQPFPDIYVLAADDSISALRLLNAGSSSGVRVLEMATPDGFGAEYATYRHVSFSAESTYPYAFAGTIAAQGPPFGGNIVSGAIPPSPANIARARKGFAPAPISAVPSGIPPTAFTAVMSFTESLSVRGGFPFYVVLPAIAGENQRQLVYPQEPYKATQRGRAVGMYQYPTPPGPIFPQYLARSPEIDEVSPRRDGIWFQGFEVSWAYEFESPSQALVGLPNVFWG